MSLFTVTDVDKRVYEEQLKDFLPDKMIDIHTHIWRLSDHKLNPDAVKKRRAVKWPALVAADNSVEDLIETYRLMFPGKDVTPLLFAGGTDDSENLDYVKIRNNYVQESAQRTGFPSLYFSSPKQSAEEIEKEVTQGGFLGLKSYLTFSESYFTRGRDKDIRLFPEAPAKGDR